MLLEYNGECGKKSIKNRVGDRYIDTHEEHDRFRDQEDYGGRPTELADSESDSQMVYGTVASNSAEAS